MSENLVPTICGNTRIDIPEAGCSDCEKLEGRVTVLEHRADETDGHIADLQECCEEVHEELDAKLTKDNIVAGRNIVVDVVGNDVVIHGEASVDLTNYYNKVEIDEMFSDIEGLEFVLVDTLPATGESGKIYLLKKEGTSDRDEYIWIDNQWELIGDTGVDLTNYYNKTEVNTLLNLKVDKVAGKGLSTNDYTDEEKAKLAGIEDGAEANVQSDWNQTNTTKDDYIKNKPTNVTTTKDGFMSKEDKVKLDSIESGAEPNVQSDWNQTDSTKDDFIKNKPTNATTSADGFMSKEDKTKLNGIEAGAEVNVQSDWNQTDSTKDDFIKNKPGNATHTANGLLSKEDKIKLDGMQSGAEPNVQSDWNQTDSTKDDFIKNKPGKASHAADGLMSKEDKTKLDGIASGAEVNVQSDWNVTDATSDAFIKNKPTNVTQTKDGFMSKEDKKKLDGINITKEGILELLDLEETTLTITGKDGTVESKTILVKRPRVPYACFDSVTKELLFFNDSPGKYAEGAVDGSKTYYINSLQNNSERGWNSSAVVSVVFSEPIDAANCKNWFAGASITGIPTLTNLNTKNVTDMSGMFYNCTSLTTLDISSFNVNGVSVVDNIFCGDSSLTTIYASGAFNAGIISGFPAMFDGCTSLVGGAGTTFNATYNSKGRAKIDGGSSNPGYFTAKP